MQRKLLTAALAAAFLTAGGMAGAQDSLDYKGAENWVLNNGGSSIDGITAITINDTTKSITYGPSTTATLNDGNLNITASTSSGAGVLGDISVDDGYSVKINTASPNLNLQVATISLGSSGRFEIEDSSTVQLTSSTNFTSLGNNSTFINNGSFSAGYTKITNQGKMTFGNTSKVIGSYFSLNNVGGTVVIDLGGSGTDIIANSIVAGNSGNIGIVELDGTSTSELEFTGATSGTVKIASGATLTLSEKVDAAGADILVEGKCLDGGEWNELAGKSITIDTSDASVFRHLTTHLGADGEDRDITIKTGSHTFLGEIDSARDVNIQVTGDYDRAAARIIARGDINITAGSTFGGELKAVGKIVVGDASTFKGPITTSQLDANADITISGKFAVISGGGTPLLNLSDSSPVTVTIGGTTASSTFSSNLNLGNGGTLVNSKSTSAGTGVGVNLDGKTVTGSGTIDNSAGKSPISMMGTNLTGATTVTLKNANNTGAIQGTFNTDVATLNAITVDLQHGIGNINVSGDVSNELTAPSTKLKASHGGTLTIADAAQTGGAGKTLDVGGAALVFKSTTNDTNSAANYSAHKITFEADNATFTGAITTGAGGVFINGSGSGTDADQGNIFTNTVTTTSGSNIEVGVNAVNTKFEKPVVSDGDIIFKAPVTTAVAATLTAEGDISLAGGTFLGSVTAKGGNITIDGTDNTLRGGIAITGGNPAIAATLAGGASASISGTLDCAFVVANNATYIADHDDTVVTRSFVAETGSTIMFGLKDGGAEYAVIDVSGAGTIDLETGVTLDADPRETGEFKHIAFTADAVNALTIDGVTPTDSALSAYLETMSKTMLDGEYAFLLDAGAIVHAGSKLDPDDPDPDDVEKNLEKILREQGILAARGMISSGSIKGMMEALQVDVPGMTALEESDPEAAYAIKIIAGLAGQDRWYALKGNAPAAYAAQQWMQGADNAGALEAVTDTVRSFNRAMSNRGYNLGSLLNSVEYDECGNVVDYCGGYKNRLWAGYTGMWGRNDGREWDAGYKYNAHGINVGYDHMTSSGIGFGASFGYSKGDYDNKGAFDSDSKIHNYSFGLFGSFNHRSGFFTTLSGSYTRSDYRMSNRFVDASAFRNPAQAGPVSDRADFHSDTWAIGGKVGHDWQATKNFTLTPTVGLYYSMAKTNTFNTSLGRYGMKYSRDVFEMPVEVTAKYDIEVNCDSTVSLIATGGYSYNFRNKGIKIDSFNMAGLASQFGNNRLPNPGRSGWNAGGGIQYRYRNLDFGVNYEYSGRKEYKSHNLNANVGVSF